mmetsp:Transcript_128138/g.227012  ORF Transcript_128138/g.227012 Transcript_128138/m.227012 type:complete len:323 (+) Transcript_128138:2119-3087(+)
MNGTHIQEPYAEVITTGTKRLAEPMEGLNVLRPSNQGEYCALLQVVQILQAHVVENLCDLQGHQTANSFHITFIFEILVAVQGETKMPHALLQASPNQVSHGLIWTEHEACQGHVYRVRFPDELDAWQFEGVRERGNPLPDRVIAQTLQAAPLQNAFLISQKPTQARQLGNAIPVHGKDLCQTLSLNIDFGLNREDVISTLHKYMLHDKQVPEGEPGLGLIDEQIDDPCALCLRTAAKFPHPELVLLIEVHIPPIIIWLQKPTVSSQDPVSGIASHHLELPGDVDQRTVRTIGVRDGASYFFVTVLGDLPDVHQQMIYFLQH